MTKIRNFQAVDEDYNQKVWRFDATKIPTIFLNAD